jgi:hypothetical protein
LMPMKDAKEGRVINLKERFIDFYENVVEL